MARRRSSLVVAFLALALSAPALAEPPSPRRPSPERPGTRPQPRPHDTRVAVDVALVEVDDGDTVRIRWGRGDVETVRVLGIDTPETRHPQHGLPYAQDFGPEARAFARGAFAAATRVELLRAPALDPYGRTLGYLFLNGRSYSALVARAGLAVETVGRYGDGGFPREAKEVLEAVRQAGPVPFEPPHAFRERMRAVSKTMEGDDAER